MATFINRRGFPSVEIDTSIAYEFLLSLCTISFPYDSQDPQDREAAEETAGWYEQVRAMASQKLLEDIEQFSLQSDQIWQNLLGLAYDCPVPRDVPTFLSHLQATDALDLRLHLIGYYLRAFRRATSEEVMLRAVEGEPEARKEFLETSFPDDACWQAVLAQMLSWDAQVTKDRLLDICRRWYDEIFKDWETRDAPILTRDARAKRRLKQTLTPKELVEQATKGVDYIPEPYIRTIILVPSFVLRPWVISFEYHETKLFCYPVADESLVSDQDMPPPRLVRLCKAFADERRLRILKKLTMGSYTLQEVANDFDVVKSTMHHHFIILRSAGLVRLRTSDNQYSFRPEAITEICDLLQEYLSPPAE